MFSTCKLYRRKGTGSISIILKKEISNEINLPLAKEIIVEYDDKKNQIIIGVDI